MSEKRCMCGEPLPRELPEDLNESCRGCGAVLLDVLEGIGEPPGSADKIYEKAFGVYPFGDES